MALIIGISDVICMVAKMSDNCKIACCPFFNNIVIVLQFIETNPTIIQSVDILRFKSCLPFKCHRKTTVMIGCPSTETSQLCY